MKIHSAEDSSSTHWLNISADQLAQIRAVLTGQPSHTTSRFRPDDEIFIADGWLTTPAYVNQVSADGRPERASAWHDPGVKFNSLDGLTWWKPTRDEWARATES